MNFNIKLLMVLKWNPVFSKTDHYSTPIVNILSSILWPSWPLLNVSRKVLTPPPWGFSPFLMCKTFQLNSIYGFCVALDFSLNLCLGHVLRMAVFIESTVIPSFSLYTKGITFLFKMAWYLNKSITPQSRPCMHNCLESILLVIGFSLPNPDILLIHESCPYFV